MLQREHSAILSTFIKLPVVMKTFVLSIFELLFYTGFTLIADCFEQLGLIVFCILFQWGICQLKMCIFSALLCIFVFYNFPLPQQSIV